MKTYLAISQLRIHNANALSSLYTVGFPAMTAWLGAVHALQRHIQQHDGLQQAALPRMAVSCHDCDVQLYDGPQHGPRDRVQSVIGPANPLNTNTTTGAYERPPFLEEPRCHLRVSLLVETVGANHDNEQLFLDTAAASLAHMKIAGGDILSVCAPYEHGKPRLPDHAYLHLFYVNEAEPATERAALRSLMPGFVLVERSGLLQALPGDDALDRLMYSQGVERTSVRDAKGRVQSWQTRKLCPDGWLVPIVAGYQDLSGAIRVEQQRDYACEHHFVEPLVTLGEFKMPTNLPGLEAMLWSYKTDDKHGRYLCVNDYESWLQD